MGTCEAQKCTKAQDATIASKSEPIEVNLSARNHILSNKKNENFNKNSENKRLKSENIPDVVPEIRKINQTENEEGSASFFDFDFEF